MRILIADDDRISRELLARVLQKQGHEVVVVQDGEEAWTALATADAPNLLIVDWLMPNLDGIELTHRIRESEAGTDAPRYILMLTSRSDHDQAAVAMRRGVDDFVAKPFHPEELQARVEVGARILALQQRLSQVARTDPLTGLPNRRTAEESLHRELVRHARERRALQVAILDADHFKRVNDTLGHQAGDDVLRELGRRIQGQLRPYDLLCRVGGEEFLVINPGNMNVSQPWERLREAVAASPIVTRAGEVELTISTGVAIVLSNSSPDEVFAVADRALFRAKNGGRNRVEREWLGAIRATEEPSSEIAPQISTAGYGSHSRISCALAQSSRALVACDDSSRGAIAASVVGDNYAVIAVPTQQELWASLRSSSAPALILLDLAVAGPEQFALVRELQTYRSQTRLPIQIVLLVNPTELDRIAEATAAGADDYLTRPFSNDELNAKASIWARVMTHYRTHAQLEDRLTTVLDEYKLLQSKLLACKRCSQTVQALEPLQEVSKG